MNVIARTDAIAPEVVADPPPSPVPAFADDDERLRHFGEELDRIRKRVEASMGEEDVTYVKRVDAFSRAMEVVGRVLIHFSLEPVSFSVGVGALWLHKQLQATEVGHTALHGAFDGLEGAERYRSKTFSWDVPIDEEAWRYGHNVRHHQYTNVAGKDPDIHFGPIRLTEDTPHQPGDGLRVPFALPFTWMNFGFVMNMHFTGLVDFYFGNGREDGFDFIERRDRATFVETHRKAFRKYVPYYLKNYVFFPALAGPFFWKVLLGNWLAEVMRDVYSAATIYCGHVGEEVASYPAGTRAGGRGRWYAMQAEASNNFEVPLPVSMLCGALDRQIEHHLFPRFPTNRLREVAPEVREVCERHGVAYRTDTWGRTLAGSLRWIGKLARGRGRSDAGADDAGLGPAVAAAA